MKKTLIVGAVLTAFTAAASAQQAPASSVTLYGIMDANIAKSETHAGATVTGMDELPNPRGSVSVSAALKTWVAACAASSNWKPV